MASAGRPVLRISSRLRRREGVDLLHRFACADLLRDAWSLWREKIAERRAAWVEAEEAERSAARARDRLADRLLNGPPLKAARSYPYCSVCDAQTLQQGECGKCQEWD